LRTSAFRVAKKLLHQNKKITILSHVNPDGDAVGSMLALYIYFKKRFLDVEMILPNHFPEFLEWLPYSHNILIYKKAQRAADKAINEAEIIFCLDCSTNDRLKQMSEVYNKSKAVKIVIDHHINPDITYDFIHSIPGISSTSELIYDFICYLGDKDLIDKEIAECIYSGIITDTGSLSFSCNNSNTYKKLSYLFNLGIDGEYIHRLIYDTFSEGRLRLLGYSISDKLTVLNEYSAAFIALSKADLSRFDYKTGDTEGVANYPLSLKGVKFAALITEKDGFVKVSLRSKGSFNVDEISKKYFNGGGHKNAAGGDVFLSFDETIKLFYKVLDIYKTELSKKTY